MVACELGPRRVVGMRHCAGVAQKHYAVVDLIEARREPLSYRHNFAASLGAAVRTLKSLRRLDPGRSGVNRCVGVVRHDPLLLPGAVNGRPPTEGPNE